MYCLVTYVELIYDISHLKRAIACVCVSFLAKYMPIIDILSSVAAIMNFYITTSFLMIYESYNSGKNIHSKSTWTWHRITHWHTLQLCEQSPTDGRYKKCVLSESWLFGGWQNDGNLLYRKLVCFYIIQEVCLYFRYMRIKSFLYMMLYSMLVRGPCFQIHLSNLELRAAKCYLCYKILDWIVDRSTHALS